MKNEIKKRIVQTETYRRRNFLLAEFISNFFLRSQQYLIVDAIDYYFICMHMIKKKEREKDEYVRRAY